MARGIPIPFNQLPQTQTNLGGFQKSAGIEGLNTDASASIQAAGNTVQADPRGFIVAAQQVGAIGQAIAGEGQAMMALQLKQNEAINIRKEHEAMLSMQLEQEAIAADMANEPDERKWASMAEARITKLKDSVITPDLSPDARDAITMRFGDWQKRQGQAVQISSANKSFEKAGDSIQSNIITAVDKGDVLTARALADQAEAAGYMTKSQRATLEGQMAQRVEYNIKKAAAEAFDTAEDTAVKAAAEGGEELTLKALDSGAFGKHSPANLEKLRSAIKQTANGRAAEVIDDLANGIAGNVYSTPEHIDAYESPHFTPALRAKAKAMLVGRDSQAEALDRDKNGVRNAVEMRQKVKAYDAKKDPDRTEYFQLVKDIGARVEQSSAGEITGELYKKYGAAPPKASVRPEIQQNVSKSLDVMFDAETGAVPWRTKTMNADGKEVVNEDQSARQKALDAQTVIEMKMADWFRDNPDKADSLPEVQKRLREVLPEGTRAAALDGILKLLKPVAAEPPNLGAPGDSGPAGPSGPLDETLVDAVKDMETFIPEAYGDYKQTSVGYGTRAKSDGEVLSIEEADSRLREELTMHAGRIDGAAQKAGLTLTANQRNALISFDFNTGRGGYLLESSGGDMKEVKRRLLLYTKAGGEELRGLVKRRKREAELFDQ